MQKIPAMIRKFAILMLALASTSIVRAQQVSEQQAYQTALKFLSAQSGTMRASSRDASPRLSLEYQARTGRNADLYIYNRQGGGFVIVSADTRTVRPILAYSDCGSIDTQNMAPQLQDILSGYQQQINYLRDNNVDAQEPYDPELPIGTVIVEPLIKTAWDQAAPYNALCPMATDGTVRRTAAGCVALAAAQVMNYWRWPERGIGSHRDCQADSLFRDFSTSVYDWDNMPISCTKDTPQVKLEAVQRLLYDCSIATDVDFNTNGTYDMHLASAMIGYFNYDARMRTYRKSSYSNNKWEEMIKGQLDAGRPIIYAGVGRGGGHAFICDGYDSENYYHFNMGWGGIDNGYYMLSAIDEQYEFGGFNDNQTMTIDIQPDYDDLFQEGLLYTLYRNGAANAYSYVMTSDSVHELVIPDSVTIDSVRRPVVSIGEMFLPSTGLSLCCRKVTLPETLLGIGDGGLYGLINLDSIYIPESVEMIACAALGKNQRLKSITVHPDNKYYHSPQGSNVIMEKSRGLLVQGCNFSVIDGLDIEVIGMNAFVAFDSLRTFTIPDCVTELENEVFWSCKNLKQVTFGTGIKTLGNNVFLECTSLEDLYFNCDAAPATGWQQWSNPVTVHVKSSALESFQSNPEWSKLTIVADVDPSTGVQHVRRDATDTQYYDLLGRPVVDKGNGSVWLIKAKQNRPFFHPNPTN